MAFVFLDDECIHQNRSSDDVAFYRLNELNTTQVFRYHLSEHKDTNPSHHCRVYSTPLQCGLDNHKIPWVSAEKGIYVLGMKRVRGTTFGHAYASIKCVHTRQSFTLAARPLHQFTTKEQMITYLVTAARKKSYHDQSTDSGSGVL